MHLNHKTIQYTPTGITYYSRFRDGGGGISSASGVPIRQLVQRANRPGPLTQGTRMTSSLALLQGVNYNNAYENSYLGKDTTTIAKSTSISSRRDFPLDMP